MDGKYMSAAQGFVPLPLRVGGLARSTDGPCSTTANVWYASGCMTDDNSKRLDIALQLMEEAIALREWRIRRENPDASDSEVDALLQKWFDNRPVPAGCRRGPLILSAQGNGRT